MHGSHRVASGCGCGRWSTIAILFANSVIFLFTYALRFREKAIVTANLAAIREDLRRQDSIHATLVLLQKQVSEIQVQVAAQPQQQTPWRRRVGNLEVDEAALGTDSGAGADSGTMGARARGVQGRDGLTQAAPGEVGALASSSCGASLAVPAPPQGPSHGSEDRANAAVRGGDSEQRPRSGWRADASRKTMLGWYVGAACLASWAVGRAMPYAGS